MSNLKKKAPILFKRLSRVYGARKAAMIFKSMPSCNNDVSELIGAFTWRDSIQGADYWIALHHEVYKFYVGIT